MISTIDQPFMTLPNIYDSPSSLIKHFFINIFIGALFFNIFYIPSTRAQAPDKPLLLLGSLKKLSDPTQALPPPSLKQSRTMTAKCVSALVKEDDGPLLSACQDTLRFMQDKGLSDTYQDQWEACQFHKSLFAAGLHLLARTSPHQSQENITRRVQQEQRLDQRLKKLIPNKDRIRACMQVATDHKSAAAMEILGDIFMEENKLERAVFWYKKAVQTFWFNPPPNAKGKHAAFSLAYIFAFHLENEKGAIYAARYFITSMELGDEAFVETFLGPSGCIDCLSVQSRKFIQKELKDRGLYTGRIDGHFGQSTRKAALELLERGRHFISPKQDD